MRQTTEREAEIFRIGFDGMRKQGFQRCINADGDCVYSDGKGNHCFIGHALFALVDDPETLESLVSDNETVACPSMRALLGLGESDGLDGRLLLVAQGTHDETESPELMEQRLRGLAVQYGVELPD